eukprot:COSAG06_NODE_5105_length_3716_cov_2.563450_3_plen_127_part_00
MTEREACRKHTSLSRAPGPIASTSPSFTFDWYWSGMMMPPAVSVDALCVADTGSGCERSSSDDTKLCSGWLMLDARLGGRGGRLRNSRGACDEHTVEQRSEANDGSLRDAQSRPSLAPKHERRKSS